MSTEQLARPVVSRSTIIVPTPADVLAIAEHYATAFVEVDGWVNTLVGAVVYKAPTDAAVS